MRFCYKNQINLGRPMMFSEDLMTLYFEALFTGNRRNCQNVIGEALQTGIPINHVYMDLLWPVMVQLEKLDKQDKIDTPRFNIPTRINRSALRNFIM